MSLNSIKRPDRLCSLHHLPIFSAGCANYIYRCRSASACDFPGEVKPARASAKYQYAVTDYSRSFEHNGGVPGIFFKYDLEAISLIIHERTTTLYQFLIRLVGVVGEFAAGTVTMPDSGHRRRMDCRCICPAGVQSGTERNEQGRRRREGSLHVTEREPSRRHQLSWPRIAWSPCNVTGHKLDVP